MKNNILKYQNPSMVIPGGVTYPIKKLLEIVAKNSRDAQAKSGKEIITDVITGRNPSFYAGETIDGGNEIDTYLYRTPYNTENTSNVGPSYDAYLSKNFPLRKHDVKTYDAHFGDTLYIDKKYKDQVLDELEQGKTVGASMGRYAHAPSYIINTKDDKRRHYDAGGHLMQFQYDQNGNVVANMSDIYDFLPKDFEDKYGAIKEYGPLKTAAMYTMHYSGTPFIVRQNNIPVRFKEIVPEYKTEWQQRLGDFLSQWGDTYDLTLPLKLTDEEIFQIFADKEYGDDILNFMFQEGYLQPKQFKKGGSIHIKKKNRGKFTKSAKCAGMGVQEFAKHILANKEDYSSTQIKRANFARNSKKFKHKNGGIMIPYIVKFFGGGGIPMFQNSGKLGWDNPEFHSSPMISERIGVTQQDWGNVQTDSNGLQYRDVRIRQRDAGSRNFNTEITRIYNPNQKGYKKAVKKGLIPHMSSSERTEWGETGDRSNTGYTQEQADSLHNVFNEQFGKSSAPYGKFSPEEWTEQHELYDKYYR